MERTAMETMPEPQAKHLSLGDVSRYREILMDKREQLNGQVESLTKDATASTESTEHSKSPLSNAENASDTYEQDFAFLSIESEEELLDKIENALERIQEGSYGVCEVCDTAIPEERLEVMPWADLCVKCQQLEEQGRVRRSGRDFELLDDDADQAGAPGDEEA